MAQTKKTRFEIKSLFGNYFSYIIKVEILLFCKISSFYCVFFKCDCYSTVHKYADVYAFALSASISLAFSLFQSPAFLIFVIHIDFM
jgi:hypothetical protein